MSKTVDSGNTLFKRFPWCQLQALRLGASRGSIDPPGTGNVKNKVGNNHPINNSSYVSLTYPALYCALLHLDLIFS